MGIEVDKYEARRQAYQTGQEIFRRVFIGTIQGFTFVVRFIYSGIKSVIGMK